MRDEGLEDEGRKKESLIDGRVQRLTGVGKTGGNLEGVETLCRGTFSPYLYV